MNGTAVAEMPLDKTIKSGESALVYYPLEKMKDQLGNIENIMIKAVKDPNEITFTVKNMELVSFK